ncbi:MAG: PEP-CTERM sorting domain-containing protein [Armatimonadetes bacterium]|nr:PEP-CTERM sorting domain-containing protein [Armatimonadota bacterium]
MTNKPAMLAGCLALMGQATLAAPPKLKWRELERNHNLPPHPQVINNNGQAIGDGQKGYNYNTYETKFWDSNGKVSYYPAPSDQYEGLGYYDMNYNGKAVGLTGYATDLSGIPFIFDNGVSTIVGEKGQYMLCINDSGLIGGVDIRGWGYQPFLYYGGQYHYLNGNADVNGIDSAGNLCGIRTDAEGNRHAIYWRAGELDATDLNAPGISSMARYMSQNGTIVGQSFMTNQANPGWRPWTYRNGVFTMLEWPDEPGAEFSLKGVTDSGQVLADCQNYKGLVLATVLWDQGKAYNMTDMVEGNHGYVVYGSAKMSSNGKFACGTYYNGRDTAFVFEIVPEPASLGVLGAGLAALLKRRRK